ncbi:FAD/NAD(P)-binding domain-containing protein [Daldinia caldariorum]|uniref:FAD/NAD(P)-binding domain-containing protein n=1 Tax=Daldinia caldariorum TaxID=326644 RepID=UPI00200844B0|nr:FAD/NAD(P)-binding domain-containing protein [Daldinia caldariorum]KAI1466386.1 FAD/NAD(P)-binding domain-containing protein [Daldinia caldariorum]
MTVKARRVAVIGAGPAGAIATDALAKEQAFDTIQVFDRRAGIGGTWVYTPELPTAIPSLEDLVSGKADVAVPIPKQLPAVTLPSDEINSHQRRFSDTALHENLHTNITPTIMSYTQEPFPNKLSPRTLADYGPGAPFRHHTVIREWIEGIFSRGGHEKLLELNTTVERAEKINSEWVLTLRKESSGRNYWWRETFDALVVATGHYNVPWFPSIPGLIEYDKKFPGRIQHSKHFRSSKKFKGKRVIVVGGSISAHEVVHELLEAAQSPVYASLRGEPIPAFGWEPFLHPDIAIKKEITNLDSETGRVTFADGSTLDEVDYIIFGTGYTFSVPYIEHVQERIRNAYRRLPGVYQHTWDIEDPTLTFVGMLGGGFTFRVYEWQAVAVARHLAGRAKQLPPIPEQLEWERKRVAERGGGKDYYSIAPDYGAFFEFLRGIAGEPAPGTTGRVLPPFNEEWLKLWTGMVTHKIEGFQRKRKRAEEARGAVKAKL